MLPYSAARKAALKTVAKACLLSRKIQTQLISVDTIQKKDRSPVTIADFAVQAIIISDLLSKFPEYPFVAEETAKNLRGNKEMLEKILGHVQATNAYMDHQSLLEIIDKGYRNEQKEEEEGEEEESEKKKKNKLWWTLDPIDGTLGFLRKEQYAVCLALMENDKPVLGVLGCPAMPLSGFPEEAKEGDSTAESKKESEKEEEKEEKEEEEEEEEEKESDDNGCLFVAVKGQGAFVRSIHSSKETKINVASESDSSKIRFTESVERTHTSHDFNDQIIKSLGINKPPLRIDSQCKYAAVASGIADVYLRLSPSDDYKENIWDHAAGYLIVREAGGVVTDVQGNELDFSKGRKLIDNNGILAASQKMHNKVLLAVKKVLAAEKEVKQPKPKAQKKKGD